MSNTKSSKELLPVFYVPEMSLSPSIKLSSPSPNKPKKVIESWLSQKFPIELIPFTPLTRAQLAVAHSKEFLDGIFNLTRDNGFGTKSKEVNDTLLYTNASMFHAAQFALNTGRNACSPTSGFHHAGHSNASGYCTFNGLMVTALLLKQTIPDIKIGIVDLDQHYGDGTAHIIKHLKTDFVTHYTFGWQSVTPRNADKWLAILKQDLNIFKPCDVILYQAGADPHIDDPLGGTLTTEQMRLRDEIVFQTFKNFKIPVCWNFAGGYQDPIEEVTKLHTATLNECLKVRS